MGLCCQRRHCRRDNSQSDHCLVHLYHLHLCSMAGNNQTELVSLHCPFFFSNPRRTWNKNTLFEFPWVIITVSQTGWHKAIEMYCFTVLEAWSPKPRCWQDHGPSETWRRESLLVSFSFWCLLTIVVHIPSFVGSSLHLWVCGHVSIHFLRVCFSLHGNSIHIRLRTHHIPVRPQLYLTGHVCHNPISK